jgi:hypothetical protein
METDILAELIRRKRQCLAQLWSLACRQRELIDQDDIGHLLDVLAVKQRLLAEMQRIEAGLDPFRGQAPSQRKWRSAEDRQRCAADLDECQRLYEQIVAGEKQSEQALIRRRDEAARQLEGAHHAGIARDAYHARSPVQIGQIDFSS